jgi:GNAT superfamily N-acetyltransferase
VPGIKGVFLVGDGRDSNVLLIVPDLEDKVLQTTESSVQEYFHQIVAAANADLAPYERVVNFAILDRDFELDRDELTPKGSYRRKAIEENFAAVIEKLYQGNYVEHVCGEIHVRIPRWFFRDLGLLETDIRTAERELYCVSTHRSLPIGMRGESRLEKILCDPTFLRQSILLAFDEEGFDFHQIPPSGIWVSPVLSQHQFDLFRVGINLVDGKHFDLLLVVGEFSATQVRNTVHWLMALSQHPWHARVLPRFGVCRPDLGVMSVAYINDMTVWDRIREYAAAPAANDYFPTQHDWRRLFVRGMAAFFLVWKSSGGRIIPGAVTPANVVVPNADYREGTCILSLTGWRAYQDPLCIVLPLLRNFYRQTTAHYPRISHLLEISWIFDACMEALTFEDGLRFLADLESELAMAPVSQVEDGLRSAVAEYRKLLQERPYMPLPLLCALDRYAAWGQANPRATPEACEEEVEQLYRLYRIDRFPPMFRYQLFRRTFFVRADAAADAAFERLLMRLFRRPRTSALHLVELSDLQAALVYSVQREVFSRMVFPRARGGQHLEVLTMGESEHKQVIVRSEIADRRGARYTVREPLLPAEVGRLYRLFRDADYPQQISEQDLQLVVMDEACKVVGGLTFTMQDKEVAYLGAFVVAASLKGRGIATALLEDFCVRMAARRVRLLKTDFFLRPYLTANGFHVDARCGGLVRHLPTY